MSRTLAEIERRIRVRRVIIETDIETLKDELKWLEVMQFDANSAHNRSKYQELDRIYNLITKGA